MPDRILRHAIWTSERVNALHDKTFRLYCCLISAADDYGLLELSFGAIKGGAALLSWTREEINRMLGELVDAGLVIPYEAEGKRFGALWNWRSFIRSVKPQHPMPNFGMGHCVQPSGFKDARTRLGAAKILSHLEIAENGGTPGIPCDTPRGTTGTEGLSVKGKGLSVSDKERDSTYVKSADADSTPEVPLESSKLPPCPYDKIVALWRECCPSLPYPRDLTAQRRAKMAARWREIGPDDQADGLNWLRKLFENRISTSPFLSGAAKPSAGRTKPFVATVDFVFRSEQTMQEILEGKYA